jgi:hypothetical protein
VIFEPFKIKGVPFKNRIVRSSKGGELSYYDDSASAAWQRRWSGGPTFDASMEVAALE